MRKRIPFPFITVLALYLSSCGPDMEFITSTKLDRPLRQRLVELASAEESETLIIAGKCVSLIEESERETLIRAGADIQGIIGDVFTAIVSSENVLSIASLEFVEFLQLARTQ